MPASPTDRLTMTMTMGDYWQLGTNGFAGIQATFICGEFFGSRIQKREIEPTLYHVWRALT